MTRYLLATDSVHTSAAACDYLAERAGPEDEVIVLAVTRDPGSERDTGAAPPGAGSGRDSATGRNAADAANVAAVRLVEPEVRSVEREGDPAVEILACAESEGAEEILLGPHSDPPGEKRVGETAQRVVAGASVPVVVLPLA